MKRILALLTLAVVAPGCSPSMHELQGSTSAPRDDAYSCIVRQFTAAGYEIYRANRANGTVWARKMTAETTSEKQYDHILATVTEAGDRGERGVSLRAGTAVQRTSGSKAYDWEARQPTEQVQADAKAVASECRIGIATEKEPIGQIR